MSLDRLDVTLRILLSVVSEGDDDLRSLERAHALSPEDKRLKVKLQRTRAARGLPTGRSHQGAAGLLLKQELAKSAPDQKRVERLARQAGYSARIAKTSRSYYYAPHSHVFDSGSGQWYYLSGGNLRYLVREANRNRAIHQAMTRWPEVFEHFGWRERLPTMLDPETGESPDYVPDSEFLDHDVQEAIITWGRELAHQAGLSQDYELMTGELVRVQI